MNQRSALHHLFSLIPSLQMGSKRAYRLLLVTTLALLGSLNIAPLYAAPHYTLHPKSKIIGPVSTSSNRIQQDQTPGYTDQIFELSVRQAHSLAKDFLDAEDYAAYWTMILASLIVPHHESYLEQFKQSKASTCEVHTNSGRMHRNHSRDLWNIFNKVFRKESEPVSPDCNRYNPAMQVTQLLGSSDVLSTGLFQVTLTHHRNFYFAGGHLSIPDTILYGQRFYLSEMKNIYLKALDPKSSLYRSTSCLRIQPSPSESEIRKGGGQNKDTQINYEHLIRGTWSGPFNSGSNKNICRFALPDHLRGRWKENDPNFKAHYDAIVSGSTRSLFKNRLSAQHQKHLAEIINQYKSALTLAQKRSEQNQPSPSAEWIKLVSQGLPSKYTGNPELTGSPSSQWHLFSDSPASINTTIPEPIKVPVQAEAQPQVSLPVFTNSLANIPSDIRWVITEALNIRTSPNSKAPVCATLLGTSPVRIVTNSATKLNGWVQIKLVKSSKFSSESNIKQCLSTKTIYVLGSLLSSERKGKFYTVTNTKGANLRATPGTGDILGALRKDETVWITEFRHIHPESKSVWYFAPKYQAWIFSEALTEKTL